jgi:hypothetical protein
MYMHFRYTAEVHTLNIPLLRLYGYNINTENKILYQHRNSTWHI